LVRWARSQPGPYDVPLEVFVSALDLLTPECDRLALMGTSFGGYGDKHWTSHWTWQGAPVPYLPFSESWTPDSDPPAYRGLYADSLYAADDATVEAATIPVEGIRGSLVSRSAAGSGRADSPAMDGVRSGVAIRRGQPGGSGRW